MGKFYITKHAEERFSERFGGPLQYRGDIRQILSLVYGASEERSLFNDSKFMIKMYDNYGYDNKYSFFVNEGIVFVGIESPTTEKISIVTCFKSDGSYSRLAPKKKYVKPQAEESGRIQSYRKMAKIMSNGGL